VDIEERDGADDELSCGREEMAEEVGVRFCYEMGPIGFV